MNAWPDNRIRNLLNVELPILLAPMAGPGSAELAVAVAEAGSLGSFPCAMLNAEQIRSELTMIRQRTARPVNLNFPLGRELPAGELTRLLASETLAKF